MTTFAYSDALNLLSLTPADVASVYSGRDGKCCCGCSGNHRYSSARATVESTRRGYEITPDEVNDRQVAKVLRIVQENAERAEFSDEYRTFYSLVLGERLYIVYLPDPQA